MNLAQILDQIATDIDLRPHIAAWHTLPPQTARTVPVPSDLHPAVARGLAARGIRELYTHQAEALAAAQAGQNVAVLTPTASGKTLCYNVPVLDRLCREPEARALYLFPTKALAQDQLAELNRLFEAIGEPAAEWKAFTYDGDTPADARAAIRQAGHIVVTNPDMLHASILPLHTRWVRLFENLRYVVIDELHTYRGVFGSHVANVLRRLRRVCRFYGADPQFLAASATIANPGELAERLIGAPVHLVGESGAPRGERHLVIYNPPVVNPALGIRRSALRESASWARRLLREGVSTIIFTRSRLSVELLLTYLRESVGDRVRGYRGGYLPNERRAIERGLRTGEIGGVVATNALELGIDIGSLDAAVLHGFPGSVASAWQQMGRAGRREGCSLAVIVASSDPYDQYLAAHPEHFLGQPPESGFINPDNVYVLMSHVKCAACELTFEDGEAFGEAPLQDVLGFLAEEQVLRHVDGRWYWMADHFPAADISLRSAAQENVVIIDRSRGARVIGEVDLASAPLVVHDQAIYLHGAHAYQVERLDWPNRKAFVKPVDVDYYTDAELAVDLTVLDVFRAEAPRAWGEVAVTAKATIFKKIKLHTQENVGWGKIHLPESELHTTAYWCTFPDDLEASLGREALTAGLSGLAHLLASLAPLYLLCDRRDLHATPQVRSPFTDRPTIYLYDAVPGGVGLAERLFGCHGDLLQAAAERIVACGCEAGCPGCVGAAEAGSAGAKAASLDLLASIGVQAPQGQGAHGFRGSRDSRDFRDSRASRGSDDSDG
ncbi:MAG TPA: DEAD/DEAH box helicase [Bacillota bacterium]|nr:DEAD/DEAH box helicase [Bacillota bacterium]